MTSAIVVSVAAIAALTVLALQGDVVAVERSLRQAEDALQTARAAFLDGDVEATESGLDEARRHLGSANSRVNRFLWRTAEHVPFAGRPLRTVSAIVDVGEETSRLGSQVLDGAQEMVGPDGRVPIRPVGGRIPHEPFVEAALRTQDLSTDRLREALDTLERQSDSLVPQAVDNARQQVLLLGQEVLSTIEGVDALLAAVPDKLGGDGPRRYFLAMQNPAELRGTGGLIGFQAPVDAIDGRLELGEADTYEVLDGTEQGTVRASAEADATFLARYASANAAGYFASVNVDPDLPTTAPVALDLYERRTGEQLDGMVVIDPIGLSALLQATGPLDVPDEVAAMAPSLPDPIPVHEVPRVLMFDLYEVFDGRPTEERREYLRETASAAFDVIFDAEWDGVEMARLFGAAVGTGHLAFYSRDAEVQDALSALDSAGSLAPVDPTHDLLAVTANNAAGNKMDLHVGHEMTGTLALSGTGDLRTLTRDLDLEVTVTNPVEANAYSTYVAGSFPLGPRLPNQRGERGLTRTWFSTWLPAPATLSVVDQDSPSWEIHGHTVVDTVLDTPAESSTSFAVQGTGPAPITAVGEDRVYTLEVHRQAKGVPDRVDLTITPPEGWSIAYVVATGGGHGGGLGPFGEPGPELEWGVDTSGNGRVRGDLSDDLVIDVLLTSPPAPLLDRFLDALK